MALYHFTMNQITRSHGQSAVNCAAYRAGEKLYDNYYGCRRDYTRKRGVIYSEIMMPDYVPDRLRDRATLWNEVEVVEKNPKSQLAHSFEIALQNELTMEENIALARKFVMENFVSRGMIVDMAIHDPPPDEAEEPENPHIHVMCPIRPMKENGQWGEKQRREYLKDEQGEPILDKKGKSKFRAVPTTDWSTKDALEEYRRNWSELVNAKFEEKGLSCRIDHRSYADRGIDLIPTIHEGVAVCQMEAKGIHTEKRALNNFIRFVNTMTIRIREALAWCENVRSSLQEELEKRENTTLIEMLQDYYDERNAVAMTYQYGRNKAELSNLKAFSEAINLLKEYDIETLEELQECIEIAQSEMKPVKEQLKEQAEEIKKMENLVRRYEDYQEFKPIADEYARKIFGRKDFELRNHNELARFHIAKRIIDENRTKEGKIPIHAWKNKVKSLTEMKEYSEEELNEWKAEIHEFRKVQRCIDQVMNTEKNAVEGAVTMRAEEKTDRPSVLSKLRENQRTITEREVPKKTKKHREECL